MTSTRLHNASAIAITGMAGRFPGATNLTEFWENLKLGRDSITRFSQQELASRGLTEVAKQMPNYVGAAGLLSGADEFDAQFFGFQSREADITDPQHRIFLQCAWNALEDAAIDPARFRGRIGVLASTGMDTYFKMHLAPRREVMDTFGFDAVRTVNRLDNIATRTAYALDLRGPAITVQTGCSSSLAAVHLSTQLLLSGECDAAIAGGVRISVGQGGYLHVQNGVLSPDGHCRPFDAKAAGTVTGSGAGVVVLRRLSDALAEGDPIHAVILGSAINNDGRAKVGYTAPSVDGQVKAIVEALALAGVEPNTIELVEAHGTATPLGDAIEVAALKQAFSEAGGGAGRCFLSSVKSNIGHLDAGAGVAGLIKAVLQLRHATFVPNAGSVTPHPDLRLDGNPFSVCQSSQPWPAPPPRGARRAGVSSFGIGGTNVHLILEQAPDRTSQRATTERAHVLALSARSKEALSQLCTSWADWLDKNTTADASIIAATTQLGRAAFNHRRAVAFADVAHAARELQRVAERSALPIRSERDVVFVFPGQGMQRTWNFGPLYEQEPCFRAELDHMLATYAREFGNDLSAFIFEHSKLTLEQQHATRWLQPAVVATSVALARTWMSFGVEPQALVGHSVGELAAACVSGVLSPGDAIILAGHRGHAMAECDPGIMVAVQMDERSLLALLPQNVCLACINAPHMCVVSGPAPEVRAFVDSLPANTYRRQLNVAHAFHSNAMRPAAQRCQEVAEGLRMGDATIPYLSNTTGSWMAADLLQNGRYWGSHILEPVRFGPALQLLYAQRPDRIYLEVGPGDDMTRLLARDPAFPKDSVALATIEYNGSQSILGMAPALGRVWEEGGTINWHQAHANKRPQRTHAPVYVFSRERHWIEAPESMSAEARSVIKKAALRAPNPAQWLYAPGFRSSIARSGVPKGAVLMFDDGSSVGLSLRARLTSHGVSVITVRRGTTLMRDTEGFRADWSDRTQLEELLSAVKSLPSPPDRVVHLGALAASENPADLKDAQRQHFDEPTALSSALVRRPFALTLVLFATSGLCDVLGTEQLQPERALLLGPTLTLPWEAAGTSVRVLDMDSNDVDVIASASTICNELFTEDPTRVVAQRGNRRWAPTYSPALFQTDKLPELRADGFYLITGGLGGIGSTLAASMIEAGARSLLLVSRSALAAETDVPTKSPSLERQRERLAQLSDLGALVEYRSLDVSNQSQIEEVVVEVERRRGSLRGVVHAAGVPDGSSLALWEPTASHQTMSAKFLGTRVLLALGKTREIDFLALCSSLVTVRGAYGQAAYTAANAFLDAVASRPRQGYRQVLAMNWATWRDVGMAAEAALPRALQAGRKARLEHGIQAPEGALAFRHALQHQGRILICPWAVEQEQALRPEPTHQPPASSRSSPIPEIEAKTSSVHPRPPLQTPYVEPTTPTQHALAEIWCAQFGLERIGVQDDFFELGGHSLQATQLMAHVRAHFGCDIGVGALFETPTIAALSEHIERDITAQIERLSDEEVLSLVDHGS